jgi:cytochrome c peroxidase
MNKLKRSITLLLLRLSMRKSIAVLLLLFIVVILSGWNNLIDEVETGPYQFVYPQNFGNRISIPQDNPTTKQGVYLRRMLFYEKKLSANNSISCASCHQQKKPLQMANHLVKG